MSGHGHVTPNANGMLARCGGPALCPECALEAQAAGLMPKGERKPVCPACLLSIVPCAPCCRHSGWRHKATDRHECGPSPDMPKAAT